MQNADEGLYTLHLGKEVTVRFGEPITVDRYRRHDASAAVPRQLTDDLMFEISQLCGQQYVDEYMKRPDEVA